MLLEAYERGEHGEGPVLGCAERGGCRDAVVPGPEGCADRREVPAPPAASLGEHCAFAEGLSRKAMVTAAVLGVSRGDEAPAEPCGARREGMDAFALLPAAPRSPWKQSACQGTLFIPRYHPKLSPGFTIPSILLQLLLNVAVNLRLCR